MNTISGNSDLSAVYYQSNLANSQAQKAGSAAKEDALDSLVSSGTITVEQQDTIWTALEQSLSGGVPV